MPERAAQQLVVALAGNPNAGKTSLFNALTGLRQKVANYPGVTVERKEGLWSLAPDAPAARLVDLPGLYSLDATSIDEQIARDVLTGKISAVPVPDVIVAVVDATNLERNLYLVTQLLEIGRPVVVALTMIDIAERSNLRIDVEKLSDEVGVPIVPVTATQHRGLQSLAETVLKATERTADGDGTKWSSLAHAEASVNGWQEKLLARYERIERIAARTVSGTGRTRSSTTERIDSWVTHRFFGPAILLLLMLLVFVAIFSWATVPMDLIDGGFGQLQEAVRGSLPKGLLANLIADGIIAGVGGVLVFLPQILLLFFFIALLEDSGYMARAAFLLDRLMRGVGLHGKAFIPLLSSFACAIPGIMATRTIENPKDRLATIMIAPLMSCSARLPVYTLMIAALFPAQKVFGFLPLGALIIMSMYLLGILVAVGVAWVLKRTILKAPPPPLVMELPPYRTPSLLNVTQTMRASAWLFVKRAGTVILAISILLWALVTFPRYEAASVPGEVEGAVTQAMRETGVEARGEPAPGTDAAPTSPETLDAAGEQVRQSFAGRAGRLIEPLIAPLGFDWKMGIALISSFAARETLVSTLSIVYNAGPDSQEDSPSLIEAVRNAKRPDGTPAWTPLVAISMMVFFVLACQCMSTVAVVRRETNSWRWPLFMVGYMLALAYVASLITFQGGRFLGFS
ncbi:MAG TPA: ferrous iron transport protein B [Pyrinomonadaceae bacterium]|nr:ferrous iron transport protein B [Pyrinomonadaceae bacterium]